MHIIRTLNPADGGPPVVAASIAAAQAELGADVRLLTYLLPGSTGSTLDDLALSTSIKTDFVPWKGWFARISGGDARTLCRAMTGSVDFVHLHGVWEPLLREAAAACRLAGIPYAVRPAGMLDPWSLRQRAVKKKLALWLGYRRMLAGAAFLHLLNEDERTLIEPLKLKTTVRIFPNGVFPNRFSQQVPAEALQTYLPQVNGRPYILFLSRLHYKKGLDYLADAFAQFARSDAVTQLVVAGPDEGERDSFQRHIKQLGLAERVHLTGPLYGEAKRTAISHATVFCLPSRQEGFSMAVTEAIACGTPCVISNACHFPEVQSHGAGYVVPLDADAIAKALASIVHTPTLRAAMSAAALHLSANYVWPVIAKNILEAYRG